MRLDQFLVKSDICTRSEAKKYVKKGRVSVNGQILLDSSAHIDEACDVVLFDGLRVEYEKNRYIMLNKPGGCVSATRDGLSDTVIDLLRGENVKDLFPVGRLDKDTEGILLITDDGALAHNLLSPKKHVEKTYYVRADGKLSKEQIVLMENGLDIGDDKPTLPAKVNIVDESEYIYELTIHEGRFHQVKRMFEKCGANVVFLKRLSMGRLKLDENLSPGEYRRLTANEVNLLKNS